jgi:hypothetical protein
MEDLETLIDCPEQPQYWFRTNLREFASADIAFANRIRSSANRRCDIREQFRAILIPLKRPWDSCRSNSRVMTSEPKIKRKGDK